MARFSGATVLLILVATVSVYTCAILAGAALGRTLDRLPTTKQPPGDSTLQVSVSVSFRSLAEDFAKELWGGNHRESRSGSGAHAGEGDRTAAALPSSAARASLPLSPAELEYRQPEIMLLRAPLREISRSDGVHEGAATAGAEPWGGYHREEGRSGDRAAAALPSCAARTSVPLTQAELQYRHRQMMMQQQLEANRRENSRGGGMTSTALQAARPLSRQRHSNFSGEITEGTRVGPWGGSGGQAFYMGSGRGASPPRLLSVTLYHADAVHAFSFEYLLQGTVVRNTGSSGGRYYGSKGRRATINFAPDEHLTAVEGTFGRCRSVPEVVVTSLTFRTDKGRTYGPYGEDTGTPFSIPAANGCIVGFWGRSGWLLDAIGVYIMPCQVYKPTFFVSNAYKATS